jgi:RNA:NAD 2'-phosphotransferase (TPT1/KptA family)
MEDTVKRTPADINLALRREGFRDVHELFNSLAMATLTPVSVDFSNNANMRAVAKRLTKGLKPETRGSYLAQLETLLRGNC